MIKDVSDAVSERIKAPLYGYVILAFVAINWKGFFFLIMTTGAPVVRWVAFENHTSSWSLYFWPVILGLVLTLAAPWLRYVFDWTSSMPLKKSRHMAFEEKSGDLEKELELKELREKGRKLKERELFDKAKMDSEINKSNLSFEEKNKLNADIEEVRIDSDNSAQEKKYYYFGIVSDIDFEFGDLLYLNMLTVGPIIVNHQSGYIKNDSIGILKFDDNPRDKESSKADRLVYIMTRFEEKELVNMKTINEYIDNYEISDLGLKFINFINSLDESDLDEFKLIIKNN